MVAVVVVKLSCTYHLHHDWYIICSGDFKFLLPIEIYFDAFVTYKAFFTTKVLYSLFVVWTYCCCYCLLLSFVVVVVYSERYYCSNAVQWCSSQHRRLDRPLNKRSLYSIYHGSVLFFIRFQVLPQSQTTEKVSDTSNVWQWHNSMASKKTLAELSGLQ